jgi:hypothetical protein
MPNEARHAVDVLEAVDSALGMAGYGSEIECIG